MIGNLQKTDSTVRLIGKMEAHMSEKSRMASLMVTENIPGRTAMSILVGGFMELDMAWVAIPEEMVLFPLANSKRIYLMEKVFMLVQMELVTRESGSRGCNKEEAP